MFTFEKIWFANPLSAKRPDSIEYVIVYNKQVLFGHYSETMTQFYRFAKQRKTLAESDNIYDLLPLFKSAYHPPTEEEFMNLFNTIWKKQKLVGKKARIHNYHNSRSLYCFLPDKRLTTGPTPSYSIFLKYIVQDQLPNDDENVYKVREVIDEVCESIEQQAHVYLQTNIELYQQSQLHA